MHNLPEILIMRHGETTWNRAGFFQGRMDSPLTDTGCAQARALNVILKGLNLSSEVRAWSSPQGRAQQTAGLAFEGCFDEWTTDARLSEIDIGEATGMMAEDVFGAFPELDNYPGRIGWQFHVPGGESYDKICARAQSWLYELQEPAVVVSHGIFIRVLRGVLLGLKADQLDRLEGGQGVVHRIREGKHDILG
jgi:probable phosphoglycerate mutase